MHTIVTGMKDEGLFITEWIAFHRVLGFETFVVFTNDCTDGTVSLLKALEADGGVIQVDNAAAQGETFQAAALRQAMEMDVVRNSDWVLHSDVDEFLVSDLEDDTIHGLTSLGANSDVIALLWRAFGDQGYTRFNGGLVHERYFQCQAAIRQNIVAHKSLFRPQSFRRMSPHMPKDPVLGRHVRAINSAGDMLRPRSLIKDRVRWDIPRELMTWKNARLHHYAVRSQDLLLLKGQRGRANGNDGYEKYSVGSAYYRRHNANETLCMDALRYSERFHREYERLMALPGVHEATEDSRRWFFKRRAEIDARP